MLRGLQQLPVWQRRIIFLAIFGGGIVFLIGCTLFLITQTILIQRSLGEPLAPGVTVREFAALPDDNAYPAAVAASPDGRLFTGSYATGAVWQIASDGTVSEIPGTRDQIGSVSGLATTTNGSLIVVDALDTDPRSAGGAVWFVLPDGSLTRFGAISDGRGFIAPDDVTVDSAGNVYVSDRGRNEVLRFAPDGSDGRVWWIPPLDPEGRLRATTGLAYDAQNDAILVTDPELNEIYRVPVSEGSTELIYQHGNQAFPPGFDGLTVAADGTIYVAALGQNGIARLGEGELDYMAGLFRGASDVEYQNGRLFVTNFDQSSLVLPLIRPSLPFTIDVIEFVVDSVPTSTPGT